MAERDMRNAIVLTALASLLWGTSFPGVKWGLDFVGNDILFLWIRFVVATALTLIVMSYLKRFKLSILKEPVIWLIGLLNAGSFVAQYVGLTLTTASKTVLLVDINVVAVAIVSFFIFSERLAKMQLGGILVGIVGIVLLTSDGGVSFQSDQFLGDVLVFAAGWGWAFFIVLNKKMLAKHTAFELSTAAITTSMIWLILPVIYLFYSGADFSIEPNGWLAMVYLGIFCTSVATLLWAMGLEGVSATASATIMLLEVVVALVLSIGLLSETLTTTAALGAALILAAIYLVSAGGRRVEKYSVSLT
jgi:drug/metabolite transporter (DMT)-like permease